MGKWSGCQKIDFLESYGNVNELGGEEKDAQGQHDNMMSALEERNVDGRQARSLAADRSRWRSLCLSSTPAR